MMTKAYSYIRMSTDIQLKGDSLRRQLELSKKYAADNGLDLVENIQDIGVSAFRGKNTKEGALGKFLHLIELGEIESGSFLLVESLDRLSRDKVTKALPRFIDIVNSGICIVTLQDNQIYTEKTLNNNPGQLFVSLGIMLRAHEESDAKSKRLSASWDNKRKNFDTRIITSICPSWLVAKEDKSGFEAIPEAAEAVKQIFKWSIQGNGHMAITRRLNDLKIPTIGRGTVWSPSYVKKILGNVAVTSVFEPHRLVNGKRIATGEKIEGYFPEIISKADFVRAQQSIKSRRGKGGRKGKSFSNIFSHLAICGACGAPLNYINKGSKSLPKLICRNAYFKSGCKSRSWTYADFERSFLKSVKSLDLSAIVTTDYSERQKDLEDSLILKQSELHKRIERQETNLEKWMSVDPEIKDQLEKVLKSEEAEIAKLKTECSELEGNVQNYRVRNFSLAKDTMSLLSEKLSQANSPESLYFLRSTIAEEVQKIVDRVEVFTNMSLHL